MGSSQVLSHEDRKWPTSEVLSFLVERCSRIRHDNLSAMTISIHQVRENAEKLRVLNARINETVKLRSASRQGWEAWNAACKAFHEQFGALSFPGGDSGWQAFLSKQNDGIELALLFLEADEITFRSGYHKQIVWDRLKRLPLSADQSARLEEVAIAYLHKRVRREFWHMARFMRLYATASFWQRVVACAAGSELATARKARWLLLVRDGFPVRRWIEREIIRQKYGTDYVARLDFGHP